MLTNAKFPQHPNVKNELSGVHIRSNAKIGANSTILPGVKIGKNSLIGAGSVITRDVGNGLIVAGNPAIIIRDIDY